MIGPFTLYSYGCMVALGFIAGTLVAAHQAKRFRISPERISTLSLVILVSGIVGARISYVLLHTDEFKNNLFEMLMVTHGGLVFYGGAAGAFLGALSYIKRSGMPFLDTADLIAPSLALGHALGRIGCLLNGCCYGKPTLLPPASMFGDHVMRYPTQVYSSLGLILLYAVLRARLQFRVFQGQVFFSYLALYAAGRFLIEFIRGDNAAVVLGLTAAQMVSIPLFLCGVIGYGALKPKTNT